MSIVKRFTFTDKGKITALHIDQNAMRLYVAVQNNTGCQLLIKSATNPKDTLYSIDISCSAINDIRGDSTHVYMSLVDDTHIGCKIQKASPTTPDYISIPSGVNEYPIRVAVGTYVQFLIPGNESSEYTRVIRYNKTDLTLDSNYELIGGTDDIKYATGMDVDSTDNVWVCTYTNPAKLIKIDSGFSFYTVNSLS